MIAMAKFVPHITRATTRLKIPVMIAATITELFHSIFFVALLFIT
jgi:hypothetical protein